MLRRLSVENYALIESLDMELGSGLNIITGETGAGKSILLGALGLVLGNRADTAALKDNEHNCVVEGVFDLGDYRLESFFEANDLDYAPQTVVRRIITPAGKSRAYVNDLPVQLAVLKELGVKLIDIHSQHQSLMLGDEDFRIRMLDAVAGDTALLEDYTAAYAAMRQTERQLQELREETRRTRLDEEYVRYQYEQLAALKLKEGEQELLEAEQSELSNTEQIGEVLGGTLQSLGDEETGVDIRLKSIEQSLQKIKEVYPSAAETLERVHAASVELRDIEALLSNEFQRIEANPERLEKVVTRLDSIYSLQQKHRVGSVEELISLCDEFGRKLQVIASSDEELAALTTQLTEQTAVTTVAAEKLSAARRMAAIILDKSVSTMLARLGMEGARFECRVLVGELLPKGADAVDFLFSSSSKLTPQPLEKIASGGETSRVMLALKAIVAGKTKLPTIVFDEIDTGVSGRIADATGEIIAELAADMQVVNITHLPQVASKGDTHFRVFKGAEGRTRIARLTAEERVAEIAKMLSGNVVTEAAVAQARQLIGESKA